MRIRDAQEQTDPDADPEQCHVEVTIYQTEEIKAFLTIFA
jgi:hypothetical protein